MLMLCSCQIQKGTQSTEKETTVVVHNESDEIYGILFEYCIDRTRLGGQIYKNGIYPDWRKVSQLPSPVTHTLVTLSGMEAVLYRPDPYGAHKNIFTRPIDKYLSAAYNNI